MTLMQPDPRHVAGIPGDGTAMGYFQSTSAVRTASPRPLRLATAACAGRAHAGPDATAGGVLA